MSPDPSRRALAALLGADPEVLHLPSDPPSEALAADRLIVIVARVDHLDHPAPGSVVDVCDRCAAEVWIAPDTLPITLTRRLAGQPVETVCMRCQRLEGAR